METFDTFTLLLQLPETQSPAVVFVANDQLTVFSWNYVSSWNSDREGRVQERSRLSHLGEKVAPVDLESLVRLRNRYYAGVTLFE